MKKPNLFYKLFISIALIGMIVIIGAAMYIYHDSYQSVYQNLLKDKERYINQISSNMSQKIQNIEFAFNAYSLTPEFEETFQNEITVTDFEKYHKVRSELNYLSIMGIENIHYSLISLNYQWMISGDRLSFLDQEETEQYRKRYIKEDKNRNLEWEKVEDGIRMVFALPGFEMDKYALGIAEIPVGVINKILSIDDNNRVVILDKNENVLFSNYHYDKTVLSHLSHQKGDVPLDNGQLLYVTSDYNKWVYAIEVSSDEVKESISSTKIALIIINLFILTAFLLFAYIIADYFTKPIVKIREKLALTNKNIAVNEWKEIDHKIENILEKNETLSKWVTIQQPELEKLFIHNLLKRELTEKEISKKLAQFDYPSEEIYYLLLIQMDDSHTVMEKDLNLLAVINILKDVFPESTYFAPTIQNETTVALIVRMNPKFSNSETQKMLTGYVEELQTSIREYIHIKISAGISNRYDSLIQTNIRYNEAMEALRYRIKLGVESIIYYDDIHLSRQQQSIPIYPQELEYKLMDDIKLGYLEQAEKSLKTLVNEIISRSNRPYDYEIAIIRLVNNLIYLAQSLNVELSINQEQSQIYRRVLELVIPEKLYLFLQKEIVKPIIANVDKHDQENFQTIAENMKEIIHNEYNQKISLDTIAERLHYNSNYLSKVFKKEYQINFSEYLMHYRLKKSKEFLVESDYTVKEIAEILQYNNSQNFIRFFKKTLGLTPGEYRKKMRTQ